MQQGHHAGSGWANGTLSCCSVPTGARSLNENNRLQAPHGTTGHRTRVRIPSAPPFNLVVVSLRGVDLTVRSVATCYAWAIDATEIVMTIDINTQSANLHPYLVLLPIASQTVRISTTHSDTNSSRPSWACFSNAFIFRFSSFRFLFSLFWNPPVANLSGYHQRTRRPQVRQGTARIAMMRAVS